MKRNVIAFIYLCISGQTLYTIPTVHGHDNLLSELLDLNNLHCTNAAVCSNNSHREPSLSWFPVPCCQPCSCQPQCTENCCPGFEERTSQIYNDQYPNVSEIPAQPNNQTTDSTLLMLKNENDSDRSNRIKTKCLRSQALYKPNAYPNSIGHLMVASCPDRFKDTAVLRKCQAGMTNEDLEDSVPITSELDGKTYANKYCLLCNELRPVYRKQVHQWKVIFINLRTIIRFKTFISTPQSLVRSLERATNIFFLPRKPNLTKTCEVYDISSCNQTGLWDMYDERMHSICEYGPSLPIVHTINGTRFLFKNIACVHCNTNGDFIVQKLSCGFFKSPGDSRSEVRSLSLNVESLEADIWDSNLEYDDDKTVDKYLDKVILKRLKLGSCSPGFAELLGRCRDIICPRHHYFHRGRCTPLYGVITGLDWNINIDVTPNQTIPERLLPEFVDKLKGMVNLTLKHSLSLQIREVSVWQLPKSSRNPATYYTCMIFLTNTSGIQYSLAVMETKHFFEKMKEQRFLILSNDIYIGVDIQFNNKIDTDVTLLDPMINGGEKMRPLSDEARKMRLPGAHLTVSNFNWCFRTGIFVDEIQFMSPTIFKLKNVDMFFYINSCDMNATEVHSSVNNHSAVYVCIDLFVSPADTSTVQNIRIYPNDRPQPTLKDYDKSPVSHNKGIVGIVTLFAVVLLGIVVYNVKVWARQRQDIVGGKRTRSPLTGVNTVPHQNTVSQAVIHEGIPLEAIPETNSNARQEPKEMKDDTLEQGHSTAANRSVNTCTDIENGQPKTDV